MKADLTACFMSTPMPNPFILASAPPTRNMEMVSRAFHEGWGGAVIKTMSQYTGDGDQALKDVSPRIFPLRVGSKFNGFNFGFMNIELGSQETHEQYCENIVKLKKEWPDRAVIASILYGSTPIKEKWCDAARDCERAGADALELNFSCPHGCSEIGSGASIGENPQKIMEILGWMKEATKLPLMVKLTAMSDIVYSSVICEENGANAICAINTVSAVPGIDISTFKPIFNVNGVGTSSGISGRVIDQEDVLRALEAAQAVAIPHNREIIHVIQRNFVVDGQDGIRMPVGMHGYRLEVEAHIITASASTVENLRQCVQAAGVEVSQFVLNPLASAEVVLSETERQMGVVVCDIGGGTTDMAIYIDGDIWHTMVLAVGGTHFHGFKIRVFKLLSKFVQQ